MFRLAGAGLDCAARAHNCLLGIAMAANGITTRQIVFKFGTSLSALIIFLIFVIFQQCSPIIYNELIHVTLGIPSHPFSDLSSILLAASCWKQGVNVYAASSCMGGGVYNYSPFLLRIAYLPITPQHAVLGGFFLDLLFIVCLSALPAPMSWGEFWARTVAAVSTSAILGLELANLDVLLFSLTVLSILLLRRALQFRLAAYGIIIIMAAIKFYPGIMLALLLRESLLKMVLIAVPIMLLGIIFVLHYRSGISTAYEIRPSGLPFSWLFGIINLPFGIALLSHMQIVTLEPGQAQYLAATLQPGTLYFFLYGVVLLSAAIIVFAIILKRRYQPLMDGMDQTTNLCLTAGALVIVSCYFIAQNVDYRGLFLMLTIPGFFSMANKASGRFRILLYAGIVSMMIVLWESLLRLLTVKTSSVLLGTKLAVYPEIAFWLFRECLWCFIVAQLSSIILAFLLTSLSNILKDAKMLPFVAGR
jgi:hypothetical protein